MILEARSLKLRWCKATVPLKALGKNPFFAPFSFSWFSLACDPITAISAFPVCHLLLQMFAMARQAQLTHPRNVVSGYLIISAKVLFPNKIDIYKSTSLGGHSAFHSTYDMTLGQVFLRIFVRKAVITPRLKHLP